MMVVERAEEGGSVVRLADAQGEAAARARAAPGRAAGPRPREQLRRQERVVAEALVERDDHGERAGQEVRVGDAFVARAQIAASESGTTCRSRSMNRW